MAYATLQALIDRFGEDELIQLTDDAGAGVVDQARIDLRCAEADGLINGYVGTRYTVPLAPVPVEVEGIACDVARYLLYRDAPSETVRAGHDAAMRKLRDIASGALTLQVAGIETAPKVGRVAGTAAAPVFTDDNLRGFV
ncbi:MAG: DUF1320 domain-containing protein [Alphaproteobacteria bacterium]|nr:DUF1320 domain-containing protein [Alphaproteobacteria bacterium]